MSDLNKGLRQPNGSVAEDMQLVAIAAQLNTSIEQVMFLRKGYTVGKARFAYDEDLNRIWLIPFGTPADTTINSVIDGIVNEKVTLQPSDLVVSNYHYLWGQDMAQGAWIRTTKDLVFCVEDDRWYRCIYDDNLPFVAKVKSPIQQGTVYTPENPNGIWEDMGKSGLGANFKGEKGENGIYVEYIRCVSKYTSATETAVGSTLVTITTKLSNADEQKFEFTIKDGRNGTDGKDGESIEDITAEVTQTADLPQPPMPPTYEQNPNALFTVDFSVPAGDLVPNIEVVGTIKITDQKTGKLVDVLPDSMRVSITNGLGEVTVPVKVSGKTGEYTVKLKGLEGRGVTFAVFITDIYMHGTDVYRRILQLEDAYRFNLYAVPNLIELNGGGTTVALEVIDFLTKEPTDIPLSTLGIAVTAGEGTLTDFKKVSAGKYSAKLMDKGEEGAIYLNATVNDIPMRSSSIVVNVVPEFMGKFWEAKFHANAKGYIGINSWCYGGYASNNPIKPADVLIYINGRVAQYRETLGTGNSTTWYFSTDNTSITDLNQVQVVGSDVLYWQNNIAEITRIGNGVVALDCANWRNTTGGLVPKFSCPLPKSIDNLNNAFQGCRLSSIDGIENWDVSHVTTFRACFAGMSGSNLVNYSSIRRDTDRNPSMSAFETPLNWDLSNARDISYLFAAGGSRNPTFLNITKLPKLTTAIGLFMDCTSVTFAAKLEWAECTTISQMCANVNDVININLDGSILPSVVEMTNMLGAVSNGSSVSTKNVTFSMRDINFKSLERVRYFTSTRGISTLDFSGSIFGEVTDLTGMLGLTNTSTVYTFSVKMVNTKFPKVITASQTFMNFKDIMSGDLDGMETPLLQNASNMFANCENVNFSDLSKIITKHLVTATGMFYGCKNINSKINHCDMSSVVDATSMFALCESFDQPLTGMKFSALTTAKSMFTQCKAFNSKIDAEFPVLNGVTEMFNGCLRFNQDIAPIFKSGTVKVANKTFHECAMFNYSLASCDFSQLTDATSMFANCSNFNQLLETISFPLLTNATSMFNNCTSFNQSVVKLNMPVLTLGTGMFEGCSSLAVPLKGFTLPALVMAARMFNACPALSKDCTNMKLPEVTSIERMFGFITDSPRIIDLTGSQFTKARNVSSLFYKCAPLSADFTNVTFDALNDGSKMFNGLYPAQVSLVMKGAKFPTMSVGDEMFQGMTNMNDAFENVDFSSLVSAKAMFAACNAFNPTFAGTKFGSLAIADRMFQDCKNFNADIATLFSPTLSSAINMFLRCENFNRSLAGEWKELTVAGNMFDGCIAFNQDLTTTIFTKLTDGQYMFRGCATFNKAIPATAFPALTTANSMFEGCLTFNSAIGLNFEQITKTASMFMGCQAFNQPLNYNLIGVVDASGMFQNCASLNQPLTNLKLPAALNISRMFMGCVTLDQPVAGFTAPIATDAEQLFSRCTLLNQEITNLVLPNVTSAKSMFAYCVTLNKAIDLTLNSVQSVAEMFNGCVGLDVAPVKITSTTCTNATSLFQGCNLFNGSVTLNMPSLRTAQSLFLNCSSFNSSVAVQSNNLITLIGMFKGCTVFNKPLNDLNVSKVTMFTEMFWGCAAFDQPLDKWNTTSVASSTNGTASNSSMAYMFADCSEFKQDISMWSVKPVSVKPSNFDSRTNAAWTTAMKPQWGK